MKGNQHRNKSKHLTVLQWSCFSCEQPTSSILMEIWICHVRGLNRITRAKMAGTKSCVTMPFWFVFPVKI